MKSMKILKKRPLASIKCMNKLLNITEKMRKNYRFLNQFFIEFFNSSNNNYSFNKEIYLLIIYINLSMKFD